MANEPPAAPAPTPAQAPTPVVAPVPQATKIKPAREVSGTVRKIVVPDTVYKHRNPVGRPKNPRP